MLLLPFAALRADEAKTTDDAGRPPFGEVVAADKPIFRSRFEVAQPARPATVAIDGGNDASYVGQRQGAVTLGQPGPRPEGEEWGHLNFSNANLAARFGPAAGYIAVDDPGDKSPLDFDQGDSITLEAWVNPGLVPSGRNIYIIGKGRTGRAWQQPNNQNYALRLVGAGGTARVSFLFRDRESKNDDAWHRWISDSGFIPGTGWHHVAVTYTFGDGDSLAGYVDGEPVKGTWDMGGKSDAPPVVDNDQVWIGSTLGGSSSNSFSGKLDEVAIYRTSLSAERMAQRYHFRAKQIELAELPTDSIHVDIIEHVADRSWDFGQLQPTETFSQQYFAFSELPHKYTSRGVIADRSPAFVVRAASSVKLPAGEIRFLLRSLGGARLKIDGKVIAQTSFIQTGGGAHGHVPEQPKAVSDSIRTMPHGHREKLVTYVSDGARHAVQLEAIIGSSRSRQEVGELSLSIEREPGEFYLLGVNVDSPLPHTDLGWAQFKDIEHQRVLETNAVTRATVSTAEAEYWRTRHALAREILAKDPLPAAPKVASGTPVGNQIDNYILARLAVEKQEPAPLLGDYAFVRRAYLDTVGVIPTPAEIERFLADPAETRRATLIDRLLADHRWADHWVSYWQDVLAENPGILKPMLNNTGPFRFWIYESMLDNKPLDRFVTELLLMEGSQYYGGPAGFEMASQNDVAMAAKAHIVGQAFLGVQMKCARCHDAPHHDVDQEDLFSVAAMLKRGPQSVPKSSSVPVSPEALEDMLIEVTLKPGSKVAPEWPFEEFIAAETEFPEGVLRYPHDSRERLATLITWPTNERFARVMANRVWKRLLGGGLVDPADDWEGAQASHPALLDYLARELATHSYDMKHVARLIMNSHMYQRVVTGEGSETATAGNPQQRLFVSPARRRMTAEQLLDSLYVVPDKDLQSEQLTMDPEGRLAAKTFLNLGSPRRAWGFVSLSNERDRPSLAFPRAQGIVDVLKTFSWRESRQDPLSTRESEFTVLQPAMLANGVVTRRVMGLSDDSALTKICLDAESPEDVVRGLFLRILSREPTETEIEVLRAPLAEGFDQRIVPGAKPLPPTAPPSFNVSWANHLSSEANSIKLEMERAARQGDPPTPLLTDAWRKRAETAIWALLNSPEFVFIP